MTEYVYIAADAPLRSGLIDGRRDDQQPNEFSMAIQDYFHFEENVNENTGKLFNFSIHFSFEITTYQVASMALNLPLFKQRNSLASRSKNTLKALECYIHEQFEHGCNQLVILYSLNSYEDEPLKENATLSLSELKYQDLYYAENRLVTITR